jgi:type III secretory pathway lipoprotein EscJ
MKNSKILILLVFLFLLISCSKSELKKIEEEAEFEEVARVMMKHLGRQVEKYHPHHTVITTSTTCELVEGCKSVGRIMDYVAD